MSGPAWVLLAFSVGYLMALATFALCVAAGRADR